MPPTGRQRLLSPRRSHAAAELQPIARPHPRRSTTGRHGEGTALPSPPLIVCYSNPFGNLLNLQALRCDHPLRPALLYESVHLSLVVMVVREGIVDLGGGEMGEGSQNLFY